MITLTRMNKQPVVVNADLIRSVEQTPDTVITMINGDHIMVAEPMQEIVRKSIEYGRHVRRMTPPS